MSQAFEMFVQVEYDTKYTGGEYSRVGQLALVPTALVREVGVEAAFQRTTGVNPVHIVHYSEDELYGADGERIEE